MLLFSFFVSFAFANAPARISKLQKNDADVDRIYLVRGLVSVLEFPKPIIEVRIGNPNVVKAMISQTSPRELTLILNNDSVGPTNVVARADRRLYAFDVIPSKSTHQDIVRIVGSRSAGPVDVRSDRTSGSQTEGGVIR